MLKADNSAATLIANRIKQNRARKSHIAAAATVDFPHGRPTPARERLSLRISPGLTDCTSISHVNRNLALALYHRQGLDVCWQPDTMRHISCPSYLGMTEPLCRQPNRPHLNLCWVAHMPTAYPEERGRLVIATSDHGTVFDKRVVDMLTTPDVKVVLALSPECAEALATYLPKERIALLPLGVDARVYRPEGPQFGQEEDIEWLGQKPEEGAFRFLIAGYAQPRKGTRETVEAFCRAFSGRRDVSLLVKTVVDHHGYDWRQEIAMIAARHGYAAVGYMDTLLTDYEMAALYRSADCLVNAHHREGFGLPPLQAMACGTPILVTDFHGPQQYAREGNAYLLPPQSIEPERTRNPDQEHRIDWAYYDLDHLAGLMQVVVRDKGRKQIIKAGLAEAAQWTWERSAETVVQIAEDNIGHLQPQVKKWRSPRVDFSIVICCRNGAEFLQRMLRSMPVARNTEIIILDDASDSANAAGIAICQEQANVQVIRSDVQLGIGGSRALLYEEACGEFIASLDADLLFTDTDERWLEQFRGLWRSGNGRFGILGPLLLNTDGTVQGAGARAYGASEISFRMRFDGEPVTAGVLKPALTCTVSGAVHFFHSSLLDHAHMDAGYFPSWFEDSDFCLQARMAGFPVRYSPEVRIIHDAHSWCTSKEGVQQQRLEAVKQRFAERWADVLAEDERLQDETGALPYEQ